MTVTLSHAETPTCLPFRESGVVARRSQAALGHLMIASGLPFNPLDFMHARMFGRQDSGEDDIWTLFGAAVSFTNHSRAVELYGKAAPSLSADERAKVASWTRELAVSELVMYSKDAPDIKRINELLHDTPGSWSILLFAAQKALGSGSEVEPVLVLDATRDSLELVVPYGMNAVEYPSRQVSAAMALGLSPETADMRGRVSMLAVSNTPDMYHELTIMPRYMA